MKNLTFLIITFLAFGCHGQNKMFEKEEKKAKEFMESKISEIYNDQFKTEFIGTWHEFGKIYGFKFYIIENNDYPIAVEYNLGNQEPFEFDKLDEPGKLSHPRRIKVSSVNQLLGFDLSVG